MESIPYAYLFVRKDLDEAQRIIQVAHAVAVAAQKFSYPGNTHVCLLQVADERELIHAKRIVEHSGSSIKVCVFYEPDHSLGFSAMASSPVYGVMRETFSGFVQFAPD